MARALRGIALLVFLAACGERLPEHEPLSGGNPRQGRELIARYGCGACHTVPGVPGAEASVGPPLTDLRKRLYIAGRLTNTPENVSKWIRDPRAIDPKSAMPAVGVDAAEARDITAYLYSR
jgi:cytochrome c